MPTDTPQLLTHKSAILDLLAQGEDAHWQIGGHYNQVVDQGLATEAGYKSAVDFFAHQLQQIPQSTLSLYGAVAKSFTEPMAKQFGCSKLGLLLTYEASSGASAANSDPARVHVLVPQKDGSIADKLFQDCTVADLQAAIKLSKTGPALPAEAQAKVSRLQAALDAALGEGKVEVRAHPRGRKVVLQLSAFDLDLAPTVADALRAGSST